MSFRGVSAALPPRSFRANFCLSLMQDHRQGFLDGLHLGSGLSNKAQVGRIHLWSEESSSLGLFGSADWKRVTAIGDLQTRNIARSRYLLASELGQLQFAFTGQLTKIRSSSMIGSEIDGFFLASGAALHDKVGFFSASASALQILGRGMTSSPKAKRMSPPRR